MTANREIFQFSVQGSARDPYHVTFTKSGDRILAYCTCPAGENGTHCKHRIAILRGNFDAIVSSNRDEASIVATWFPGSNIERAVRACSEAEKSFELAKQALAKAKKDLTASMMP